MKTKQLSHLEVKNKTSNKELIVVAENIRTPENVGMIFRVCEAFGVKKVILVGDSPNLSNSRVLRTARNTQKELTIQFVNDVQLVIQNLKEEQFQLIGLEYTNNSETLKGFDFSRHQKIAVFLGAERSGIENNTLQLLDNIMHIELFGKNSSINVVNALAILLYEVMR